MRRLLCSLALICALTGSAFAGQMGTPLTDDTAGVMGTPLTDADGGVMETGVNDTSGGAMNFPLLPLILLRLSWTV